MKFITKHRFLRGFTLVEFAGVAVMIAILSSIAIPTYVDIKARAQESANLLTARSINTAFAIAVADQHRQPTVQELTNYIELKDNEQPTASSIGIEVPNEDGVAYVLTYVDSNCQSPTQSVDDQVSCVDTKVTQLSESESEGGSIQVSIDDDVNVSVDNNISITVNDNVDITANENVHINENANVDIAVDTNPNNKGSSGNGDED